ncbi:cobalamin biosynthesis protein CbiX [Streptomyces sp. G-G2]|uniref:sirohydrochlorin chelatase n=1 Tax=Streptomyces sp. G-G2 TaxID=3046201 RepID=UPI0024B8A1E8|nr:cobalamin biosynthesis protein CbiX [Streptomyces sp. G-G2]MDJ0379989.1 cobalamin biosynthesis protein CbiX [Streptomyces sp. G-G2]
MAAVAPEQTGHTRHAGHAEQAEHAGNAKHAGRTPRAGRSGAEPPVTVVLAAGHEGGAAVGGVSTGRPLAEAVGAALDGSPDPVCVVPMTLGRDPKLIADCARALRWLGRGEGAGSGGHGGHGGHGGPGSAGGGRLVLAPPFATADHLTAWLRTAALKAVRSAPETSAVLVTAPASRPFEDADLFRVARLVRQYGRHRWVEVAFDGGDPDVAEGVERCLRLGARHVGLVRAAFGPLDGVPEGVLDTGPLLTGAAVDEVLRSRVAQALHRLTRGDDGIGAGLDAEHGHGYAHTHGPGDGHSHPHGHDHSPH